MGNTCTKEESAATAPEIKNARASRAFKSGNFSGWAYGAPGNGPDDDDLVSTNSHVSTSPELSRLIQRMRAGKPITRQEANHVAELQMLCTPYLDALHSTEDTAATHYISPATNAPFRAQSRVSMLECIEIPVDGSFSYNGELPSQQSNNAPAAVPNKGGWKTTHVQSNASYGGGVAKPRSKSLLSVSDALPVESEKAFPAIRLNDNSASLSANSLRLFTQVGPRPSKLYMNSSTLIQSVESASVTDSASITAVQITDPAFLKLIEESNRAVKRRWLLYRCWSSVMDRESTGLETSFVELLHQAGARIIGTARVDLFTNLVARKNLFMDAMLKLFEQGLDNVDSVYLLHQIGARHVAYGLTRQDYEAYMGPFVRTVVACAHPSTMDGVVRHLLREFWQSATRMMMEGAVEQQGSQSMKHAPKSSPFALLFTDIEGSTGLWEGQPAMMETAVDQHHRLMRDLIQEHNGYEVKTIGDSFMIAFKSLADAVTFALRTQLEFLRASVEGLVVDGTTTEASGPGNLWNNAALRVRIGLNWCTDATPKFDNVYKRYDFYGNDVNTCARVQDAACGGQILVSESTLQAINALGPELEIQSSTFGGMTSLSGVMAAGGSKTRAQASLRDVLGSSLHMEGADLKGLSEPVTLHSIFPKVLAGRIYGRRKKDIFASHE